MSQFSDVDDGRFVVETIGACQIQMKRINEKSNERGHK